MNKRQCHFLFLNVYSCGFPDCVLRIVEQVIFDLETHSYELAKFAHVLDLILIFNNRFGTKSTAGSDKSRRLFPNYLVVNILSDVQSSCILNLKQFTFAHFANGNRNDFKQIEISIIYGKQQYFREQIITYKQRNFVFPKRIYGEKTSSSIAVIDHIIMNQCCRMNQLNNTGPAIGSFINNS